MVILPKRGFQTPRNITTPPPRFETLRSDNGATSGNNNNNNNNNNNSNNNTFRNRNRNNSWPAFDEVGESSRTAALRGTTTSLPPPRKASLPTTTNNNYYSSPTTPRGKGRFREDTMRPAMRRESALTLAGTVNTLVGTESLATSKYFVGAAAGSARVEMWRDGVSSGAGNVHNGFQGEEKEGIVEGVVAALRMMVSKKYRKGKMKKKEKKVGRVGAGEGGGGGKGEGIVESCRRRGHAIGKKFTEIPEAWWKARSGRP